MNPIAYCDILSHMMNAKRTTYEFIREIFNNCSGNQMRDIDISEIETDDLEAYLRSVLRDDSIAWKRTEPETGVTVFEVDIDGLRERFTFTEI